MNYLEKVDGNKSCFYLGHDPEKCEGPRSDGYGVVTVNAVMEFDSPL